MARFIRTGKQSLFWIPPGVTLPTIDEIRAGVDITDLLDLREPPAADAVAEVAEVDELADPGQAERAARLRRLNQIPVEARGTEPPQRQPWGPGAGRALEHFKRPWSWFADDDEPRQDTRKLERCAEGCGRVLRAGDQCDCGDQHDDDATRVGPTRFVSHHCGCISCAERHWSDDPAIPKRTPAQGGEQHIDIHTPRGRALRGRCKVTLDGRDVTDDVFELVTGVDGWVAVYSRDTTGRRHACRVCNDHVCSLVERGHVVLEVLADAAS